MKLVYTGRFKNDFKRMMRRNKNEGKLFAVVEQLMTGRPLPAKYRPPAYGQMGKEARLSY